MFEDPMLGPPQGGTAQPGASGEAVGLRHDVRVSICYYNLCMRSTHNSHAFGKILTLCLCVVSLLVPAVQGGNSLLLPPPAVVRGGGLGDSSWLLAEEQLGVDEEVCIDGTRDKAGGGCCERCERENET